VIYACILLQEALAIVLDVGPGMSQGPDGDATYFEQSRTAVDMILQRKVCCCSFPYCAGSWDHFLMLINYYCLSAYARHTVLLPSSERDAHVYFACHWYHVMVCYFSSIGMGINPNHDSSECNPRR